MPTGVSTFDAAHLTETLGLLGFAAEAKDLVPGSVLLKVEDDGRRPSRANLMRSRLRRILGPDAEFEKVPAGLVIRFPVETGRR